MRTSQSRSGQKLPKPERPQAQRKQNQEKAFIPKPSFTIKGDFVIFLKIKSEDRVIKVGEVCRNVCDTDVVGKDDFIII